MLKKLKHPVYIYIYICNVINYVSKLYRRYVQKNNFTDNDINFSYIKNKETKIHNVLFCHICIS